MEINIKDSVLIAVIITLLLLYAMLNSMWVNNISIRVDDVQRISDAMDGSIMNRITRLEQKLSTCGC